MSWKDSIRYRNGKRAIWRYAQADFARACSLSVATDWHSLLTGDVNVSMANWEANYMEINYRIMYPKKFSSKKEKLTMFDKNLNRAIRKRNVIYRHVKRDGNCLLSIATKNKRTKL